MKKISYWAILLCMVGVCCAASQEVSKRLSNQDIIDMVKLGVSNDVIIAKIRSANGQDQLAFDTSVEGMKSLKAANVPDDVIKVMINPAPVPVSIAPAASGSAPAAFDPNFPPPEVGVYWRDGASFVLIEGQALSRAKVGGRAGSFFTDGMRSEHWDAYLEGPTSKNRVKDRQPHFYLYVPDGISSADYVLIKLEKKGDRREFQIGSFGGVTAGKSGVKQDKQVQFKAEHVAIRTYKISLDADLKPGEYAFFQGTGQQTMMAGGRGSKPSGGSATGRIYDFTVPE
jgi:hypothetical protein